MPHNINHIAFMISAAVYQRIMPSKIWFIHRSFYVTLWGFQTRTSFSTHICDSKWDTACSAMLAQLWSGIQRMLPQAGEVACRAALSTSLGSSPVLSELTGFSPQICRIFSSGKFRSNQRKFQLFWPYIISIGMGTSFMEVSDTVSDWRQLERCSCSAWLQICNPL